MKNITTKQFEKKTKQRLQLVHETDDLKVYKFWHIVGQPEYTVETDDWFFIIDSDGNGSMPEEIAGTKFETELLTLLKNYEKLS